MSADRDITQHSWQAHQAREWIAVPLPDSDKYSRGVLGVVTGSAEYPGAAVLGVDAAVRTGVGMVRYVGAERAADFVLRQRPEVVTGGGRVQAWLVGSGIDEQSRDAQTTDTIRRAIGADVAVVIDAGALDMATDAVGPVIVTPHFRELSRLLETNGVSVSADEIGREPRQWAARTATELGVSVLLKGETTCVASPDGELFTVRLGEPWLATAGSGDVLAGILGALVATHAQEVASGGHAALVRLGATAAAVHAVAGRRASAGGPIAALDIAEAVPATIAHLLGTGSYD